MEYDNETTCKTFSFNDSDNEFFTEEEILEEDSLSEESFDDTYFDNFDVNFESQYSEIIKDNSIPVFPKILHINALPELINKIWISPSTPSKKIVKNFNFPHFKLEEPVAKQIIEEKPCIYLTPISVKKPTVTEPEKVIDVTGKNKIIFNKEQYEFGPVKGMRKMKANTIKNKMMEEERKKLKEKRTQYEKLSEEEKKKLLFNKQKEEITKRIETLKNELTQLTNQFNKILSVISSTNYESIGYGGCFENDPYMEYRTLVFQIENTKANIAAEELNLENFLKSGEKCSEKKLKKSKDSDDHKDDDKDETKPDIQKIIEAGKTKVNNKEPKESWSNSSSSENEQKDTENNKVVVCDIYREMDNEDRENGMMEDFDISGIFNKVQDLLFFTEQVKVEKDVKEKKVKTKKTIETGFKFSQKELLSAKMFEPVVQEENTKHRMCRLIETSGGKCPRSFCKFAHTFEELTPVTCNMQDKCNRMNECEFLHGKETKEEYLTRLGFINCAKKIEITIPATSVKPRNENSDAFWSKIQPKLQENIPENIKQENLKRKEQKIQEVPIVENVKTYIHKVNEGGIKSRMCNYVMNGGKCTRKICTFAHTLSELLPGICCNGNKCRLFLHEKRSPCIYIHDTESKEQYLRRVGLIN